MNSNSLYFGIPLISREAARDWGAVTRLFNKTLASIYNQSDGNFKILVACHDVPTLNPAYKNKTEFLPIKAPIPTTNWEMMLDKGAKKQAIGRRLHELGGGYLMFMDADDLVHRELVAYALRQQHSHGYLLKQGYELDERRNTIRKVSNFDQLCGSCAIVYFQPDDLPSKQDDNLNGYFDQFRNHSLWHHVAISHNRPLAEIPFEAAVYVRNTGENHSARLLRRRLKQKLLSLFGNASIDERICKDFCL